MKIVINQWLNSKNFVRQLDIIIENMIYYMRSKEKW